MARVLPQRVGLGLFALPEVQGTLRKKGDLGVCRDRTRWPTGPGAHVPVSRVYASSRSPPLHRFLVETASHMEPRSLQKDPDAWVRPADFSVPCCHSYAISLASLFTSLSLIFSLLKWDDTAYLISYFKVTPGA